MPSNLDIRGDLNSHDRRSPAWPTGRDRAGAGKLLVGMNLDDNFTRDLRRAFKQQDWELQLCDRGHDALVLCGQADAFIVDVCPEGRQCIELIGEVKSAAPCARVVAVTAYPSLCVAVAAIKAGADDCLLRSATSSEFLTAVSAEGDAKPSENDIDEARMPSLARLEWEHIARVLDQVGCNISVAARALGIQRSTLQRKLKKYPPQW
jgi:two-component system response regulator RegA